MEGPMEEGVGSLMMAQADPPMDPSMMEVGNTPPVNFRHGGPVAVRGYAGNGENPSGEVKKGGGKYLPSQPLEVEPYFQRALDARENLFGTPEQRAASMEASRNQAQSDALFGLSRFGLALAGETEGGSVAERFANAARKSQVVEGLQQAGSNLAAEGKLQTQQDQQTRLSALQSAEQSLTAAEGYRQQSLIQDAEFANKIAMQANEISLKRDVSKSTLDQALDLAKAADKLQRYVTDTSNTTTREMTNAQIVSAEKLAEAKNLLTQTLAEEELDLRTFEGLSDRQHAVKMESIKKATAVALTTLTGDLTQDQIKTKARLEVNLRRVDAAIAAKATQADFQNQLLLVGVSQDFDLERMELQQEFTKENVTQGFKNRLQEITTIEGVDKRKILQEFNNSIFKIDMNAENARESVEQALENTIKINRITDAQTVSRMRLAVQQDLLKMGMGQEFTLEAMNRQAEIAAEAAGKNVAARLIELGVNNAFKSSESGKAFLRSLTTADISQENVRETLEIQLRNALKLNGVNYKYTRDNMVLQLNQDLVKMGMGQEFKIELMTEQLADSKDLATFTDKLSTAAREDNQAFQAGESLFNRMLTREENAKNRSSQFNLQVFDQEFRRDLTQMGLDDKAIDRQVARVNQSIQNAFETHRLMQGDEQLTLQGARDAFDQHYKSASLYLDAQAAKVSPIASKGLDATLRFFSDPELIKSYADGSLDTANPEMKNLLEGLISNYSRIETSVNAMGQAVTKPAAALNTDLQAAIQARSDNGLSIPTGSVLKVPPFDKDSIKPLYLDASENLNLIDLLDDQGRVDLKAPGWQNLSSILIDPKAAAAAGVEFSEAQGLTGGITRIGTFVGEVFAELRIGNTTKYQDGLIAIDKSLINLVGGLRKLKNRADEGRVLKFAQLKDEELIEPLAPGTWKTDLSAKAAAEGLLKELAMQFQVGSEILRSGERGEPVDFTKGQITTARKDMIKVANFMIELDTLIKAYESSGGIRLAPVAGVLTEDRAQLKKVLQAIQAKNAPK